MVDERIRIFYGTGGQGQGIVLDGIPFQLAFGTDRADRFMGSSGDDLIFTNGAARPVNPISPTAGGVERINGGAGNDTVVLPGFRSDYTSVPLGIRNYGRRDSFGNRVTLMDGQGNAIHMQGVETIVFGGEELKLYNPAANRRDIVERTLQGIANGNLQTATASQLANEALEGLSPVQQERYRTLGHPEVIRAYLDSTNDGMQRLSPEEQLALEDRLLSEHRARESSQDLGKNMRECGVQGGSDCATIERQDSGSDSNSRARVR